MSAIFELNHDLLAGDPKLAGVAHQLSALPRIDSSAAFNRYCQEACRLWREQVSTVTPSVAPSELFTSLLERINRREAGTIPTSWGGVVVTLHEHPRVEKYLVIRQGGYLALEKHEQKDEHLEVREGAGLLLARSGADEPLTVAALAPGERFHFEPGMEHCLIGTENLLVFERSTDPKGMDKDLIFLYEPDEAS